MLKPENAIMLHRSCSVQKSSGEFKLVSLVILKKFWDQFIKLTFRIGILQTRMILIVDEIFFNLLGISRPSFNASRLVYVLV